MEEPLKVLFLVCRLGPFFTTPEGECRRQMTSTRKHLRTLVEDSGERNLEYRIEVTASHIGVRMHPIIVCFAGIAHSEWIASP